MTTSGPEESSQPFGGTEDPPLENPTPQPDPNPTIDYPTDAGLPPPVYPPYPGTAGYPGVPAPGVPGMAGMPAPGVPGVPTYCPGAYDPYAPVKPRGTNGRATAALVTSLAGLLCCGLPSIAGLFLGVIAMRETKRTGQDGYTVALIGAIIGGLVVAGWVVYLLVSISVYATGWQWAP